MSIRRVKAADFVAEHRADLFLTAGDPTYSSSSFWRTGGDAAAVDLAGGDAHDGEPEEVVVFAAKVGGKGVEETGYGFTIPGTLGVVDGDCGFVFGTQTAEFSA